MDLQASTAAIQFTKFSALDSAPVSSDSRFSPVCPSVKRSVTMIGSALRLSITTALVYDVGCAP